MLPLVTVEVGEIILAVITPLDLLELGVNIGDTLWGSFKPTSAHVFSR